MEKLKIIDTNSQNIGTCAFCGYKNPDNEGHKRKVAWLKDRYHEGLKFKVLRSERDGDVGFIEYTPGEFTWKPVIAKDYMVIHCLMIIKKQFKGKGFGEELLNHCIDDAYKSNLSGVAVITSKGSFITSKDLFIKNGFEIADTAPPHYELLVKKFKNAADPVFTGNWEKNAKSFSAVFISSDIN